MNGNVRPLRVLAACIGVAAAAQLACAVTDLAGLTQAAQPAAAPGLEAAPPGAPTTAPPPAAVAPLPGDTTQALVDSYNKLQSAYPYRLTENSTEPSTNQPTVRVVEYAAPGENHATFQGGAMGSAEVLNTGGRSFMNIGGQWIESTQDPAAQAQMQSDIEQQMVASLSSVQLVGPEVVNGVETLAYTFQSSLEGTTVSGKTWIGVLDGLPHQTDMTLDVGGVSVTSHIVYEYGVNVVIPPPPL